MSLTILSTPNNIDNSAAFNITTSLVEDSTHVNLRVRADIYHEGVIKATVEKPKGIADFDFKNILKSLTPGLLFPRDSGDIVKGGTVDATNLITYFSQEGTFDSVNTSGIEIIIAQKIGTDATYLLANDITVQKGSIYVIYLTDYVSTGVLSEYILLSGAPICQDTIEYTSNNKSLLIMPVADGIINIRIGRWNGQFNLTGKIYLYKITTNRSTIGNPLAPYFINFKEIYENSSGVTTAGASSATKVYRYVPAKGDDVAFSNYILSSNTSRFACATLKNNIVKFYTAIPLEYWLCFYTEYIELELNYSKDGGSNYLTESISCYEGWEVLILNIGELMAPIFGSSITHLMLYLKQNSAQISEIISIYKDSSSVDERVVLEFDGLIGGKEYLAFEGLKNQEFGTIRNYYTKSGKNRGLTSVFGFCRQILETLFKDQPNAEYLKSLLISDNIKRLEASYADPTDVTVITDQVTINKGREMFTNQIQIEYEY